MNTLTNTINICFAATPELIPYATVGAISIIKNLKHEFNLNIYFLYANINNIPNKQLNHFFECAKSSFNDFNININFYDVEKYINIFEGQNIGMWGKEKSLSHYMYLLSPLIIKNIEKIIYLDTDIIVNCDLSSIFSIDLGDYLLAMGAPRGYEDMGEDVSNSGFVFINLKKWREENTLTALLEFGRKLPKSQFCDQYLLHEYFKKNNSNRLLLVDKNYNIFPHLMTNISIEDMKILHFTGYNNIKPWDDIYLEQRGSFLFWKYARLTNFYEFFIFNVINKHINVLTNEIKEYKYEFNEYKNENKLLIKIKNKIHSLIHKK